MRATLLLALLAAAVTALPAAAAAPLLAVPQSSFDGSVVFGFRSVDVGSVAAVDVGGKNYQRTVTDSSFTILVEGLQPGFQRWYANVTLGNSTWRDSGYVHVDTAIHDIGATVAALESTVAVLQNRSEALATNDARLAENLTAIHDGVQDVADTTELVRAQNEGAPPNSSVQAQQVQPGPVGLDIRDPSLQVLLGVVAACVLLLLGNVALVVQMRKRNRESMVFLLAIAGHEGVTPESPEFQRALEALNGKPKKAKKEKKAKAHV